MAVGSAVPLNVLAAGADRPLRVAVMDSDSGFLLVLSKRLERLDWQHRMLALTLSAAKIAALELDVLIVDLASSRRPRRSSCRSGDAVSSNCPYRWPPESDTRAFRRRIRLPIRRVGRVQAGQRSARGRGGCLEIQLRAGRGADEEHLKRGGGARFQ